MSDQTGTSRCTRPGPSPSGPGTADDSESSGVRGQDTGGQDGGRAETRPGPGGARQDQSDRAGLGEKIAAHRRRRVGPSEFGAGRGRQTTEPHRRRRVF